MLSVCEFFFFYFDISIKSNWACLTRSFSKSPTARNNHDIGCEISPKDDLAISVI